MKTDKNTLKETTFLKPIIGFVLLVVLSFFAQYYNYNLLENIVYAGIVPVFLFFHLMNNVKFEVKYIIILALYFMGGLFWAFKSNLFFGKLSIVLSTAGICYLAFISIKNLKRFSLKSNVILIILAVYFLNFGFTVSLISDFVSYGLNVFEIFFLETRCLMLLTLTFASYTSYIDEEDDEKREVSVTFLIMAICFIFSNIMYYIDLYYSSQLWFEILDRIFYITGFYLFFQYIKERNLNKATNKELILS